EVCFGSVVNFIDGSSAANSSVTQWNWDFGDGTTSTTQNPAKNYSAAGTYTVTLTVTSAIGCVSNTFTKQVIVDPLPTPLFNVSSPTCATRDVTFTDASLANAGNLIKWTWDYGDATTAVLNNNNPFTHNYNSTGTYHVTLKVETDKGCVSSLLAKDIVVSPLPVANFGIPESCLSDPFSQFTDSSLIADGTESQFTYNWNFGDPNANPGDPNTSTIKNPLHKYTATGPYNITLTVTSNSGCASTTSKPFFVNGAIPIPSFTVAGGTAQCSSNIISISNTSTVNPGNVVKLEIYWDNTVDPTIKTTDDDPVPGKVYTHNYTEFGSPASRTATIKLVAYSGQTCLMSVDQVITLYATPQIQFNSLAGVCADVAPFTINQASEINNQPGTGVYSGPG
ncbi:MAG: PKD domain-containing protein, partial [Bacteroidetes bacterium]|nr:PKD domain-containing protein [Bacteroidota bacterium]